MSCPAEMQTFMTKKRARVPEQSPELKHMYEEKMGSGEPRPHVIIQYMEGSITVYARVTLPSEEPEIEKD